MRTTTRVLTSSTFSGVGMKHHPGIYLCPREMPDGGFRVPVVMLALWHQKVGSTGLGPGEKCVSNFDEVRRLRDKCSWSNRKL